MSEPLTKHTGHLCDGLAWMSEQPTVPGWYWLRAPKHGWRDSIVWIERDGNDGPFYMPDDDSTPLDEIEGQWLGPIPLPTDAPAQDYYKASEVEALIAGCIPTNWCDPLLTGDRRVIGDAPYNCDDIEALLTGIKRRLLDQIRKGRG